MLISSVQALSFLALPGQPFANQSKYGLPCLAMGGMRRGGFEAWVQGAYVHHLFHESRITVPHFVSGFPIISLK